MEQHLSKLCARACAELDSSQASAATTQQLALAALGAAAQARTLPVTCTSDHVRVRAMQLQHVHMDCCIITGQPAAATASFHPLHPLGVQLWGHCLRLCLPLRLCLEPEPSPTTCSALQPRSAGLWDSRLRGSAGQHSRPAPSPELCREPASEGQRPGGSGSRPAGLQGCCAAPAASPGACPHGSCTGCSGSPAGVSFTSCG